MSSSPGASAVSSMPLKNSAAGIERSPVEPCARNRASRASITAGSSADGSACAMLPPTVPRFRICGCAMDGSASARSGAARATTSLLAEARSEEHTSELQSLAYLVCRLLLEKKNDPQEQVTYSPLLHPLL